MNTAVERAAKSEAERDSGIASFVYVPSRAGEVRLALVMELGGPIEHKEFVCELHLYNEKGGRIPPRKGDWTVSETLEAPFQYLPVLNGSSVVTFATYVSPEPFVVAYIYVREWETQTRQRCVNVKHCLVAETIETGDAVVKHYRELDAYRRIT